MSWLRNAKCHHCRTFQLAGFWPQKRFSPVPGFQDAKNQRKNVGNITYWHMLPHITYLTISSNLRMSWNVVVYLELKYVWLRRAALEGRLQWVVEDFMSRCAVAWSEQTTREHGNSKSQKHLLYFIKSTKQSSTVSCPIANVFTTRQVWKGKHKNCMNISWNVSNNFGFVDVLDLWKSLKEWTLSASVSNGLGL